MILCRKIEIAWEGTLAQSPACRMDTRKTPASNATQSIYAFAILKTFLTQEEIILAHAVYCYPKAERTHKIDLTSSQNIQHNISKLSSEKNMAKINNRVRFNTNLMCKMTWSIHLTTRCRNKNMFIMLK